MGTVAPVLQVGKLRHRTVKKLARSHRWQVELGLESRQQAVEPVLLATKWSHCLLRQTGPQ